LQSLGLGYLAVERSTTTLSAGELQRLRLATQIRWNLFGVVYVLDEPSTGLHAADVDRLMAQLQGLVDAGNTVVLVEHDMRVVASGDWVIDIGPGAGAHGGRIVAQGPPAAIVTHDDSRTAPYLRPWLTGAE